METTNDMGSGIGSAAAGSSTFGGYAVRVVLERCAICKKELTDAASVEIGIGPVCRVRCEYDKIPEHLRVRANQIIRRVAVDLDNRAAIMVAGDELREMGLDKLACCLVERFATIFVAVAGGVLAVLTPYDSPFAYTMRSMGAERSYESRKLLNRGRACWVIGENRKAEVWAALKVSFAGCVAKVRDGEPVWIPAAGAATLQASAAI